MEIQHLFVLSVGGSLLIQMAIVETECEIKIVTETGLFSFSLCHNLDTDSPTAAYVFLKPAVANQMIS